MEEKNLNNMELANKISYLLDKRKKRMFGMVLESIEKETKRFSVNGKFFSGTNGEGFNKIRDTLFDLGNDISRLVEHYLDFVKGFDNIKITDEVLAGLNDNNNGKRKITRPKAH